MTLTCRAESRVNMINLAARTILARATSQPAFWAWSNSLSSLLLLTWWVPLHWTRRISVSEQNSFLDQGLNFCNPWRSTNSYHTILFSCFNLVCTLQQQLAHLRQKVGPWKAEEAVRGCKIVKWDFVPSKVDKTYDDLESKSIFTQTELYCGFSMIRQTETSSRPASAAYITALFPACQKCFR